MILIYHARELKIGTTGWMDILTLKCLEHSMNLLLVTTPSRFLGKIMRETISMTGPWEEVHVKPNVEDAAAISGVKFLI